MDVTERRNAMAHFANMTLDLWLFTGTFAMGYRRAPMQISDIASGALIILLAALSLSDDPS